MQYSKSNTASLLNLLMLLLIVSGLGSCSRNDTDSVVSLPTVSTAIVTNITGLTATSGGSVTNQGGTAVIAQGVCWNSSSSPTLNDDHSSDAIGTSLFTSSLTGLTPGTNYHVRAFATNGSGTAYGNEVLFTTTGSATEPDVYICGDEITNPANATHTAKIWVNGVETLLSDGIHSARAFGMAVKSGDVYVVGSLANSTGVFSPSKAVYWKNGLINGVGNSSDNSVGRSVFINNSDVYVAGWENYNGGNAVVKLWKNGVGTILSNGATNGGANAVVVSGSDVYVAGMLNEFQTPVLYKNGVQSILPTNGYKGDANAIYVDGSDVYVVGGLLVDEPNSIYTAAVWKNGNLTTPENLQNSYLTSITVSGGNVYMAGLYFRNGAVWKNNVRLSIPNISNAEDVGAIAVRAGSIYVTGSEYLSSSHVLKYYKDGVPTALTNGTYLGYLRGMVLVN